MSLPEVEETTPFGPEVLVYKVAGKMFAATDPDAVPPRINLKCDPDEAIELRDSFEAVQPGWHMNKRHWNTVVLDSSLPEGLETKMVVQSYLLVVQGMKKSEKERLQEVTTDLAKEYSI